MRHCCQVVSTFAQSLTKKVAQGRGRQSRARPPVAQIRDRNHPRAFIPIQFRVTERCSTMDAEAARREASRLGAERHADAAPRPQSSRDRKRADILAAAKEVFFNMGYAGASMDQITARSGVSKATVYAHFRSKDDLLLGVVEDVIETIRSGTAELPSSDDFREWLMQLGRIASSQLTSPAAIALQRLAISEAARFPEIARAFHQSGVSAAFAPVTLPGFEAAMAKGILKQGSPSLALAHFFEMCFGKMLRDVLMGLSPPPNAREIEANVRSSVEAFLHGYAA